MDSLIKLNTRNELIVANRVITHVKSESRYGFDSINRINKQIDLIYCLEQDFPGDSTALYKKVRDFSDFLFRNDHRAFRGPRLYGKGSNASLGWLQGGFRRSEGSIVSARTDGSKSRIRGGYVGAPGGKLMRAEDWTPNLFGGNSQLYLAGMLAARRMAKRFDFTAMGMVRV